MNSGVFNSIRRQIDSGGQGAAQIAATFASRVEADGGVTEAQSCLIDRITLLKNLGLWDKASAVWLPHGYKESKLYAAKGGANADLTIVRAGTKTRKGATYVEQVPYNILSRSEEFDNAYWTKSNCTITANATQDPLGNMTSDLFTDNTTSGAHGVFIALTKPNVAVDYTFSLYAKANALNWIVITVTDATTDGNRYWYNISTGEIGSTVAIGAGLTGLSASIETSTNGFYRCIFKVRSNALPNLQISWHVSPSDGVVTYVGSTVAAAYFWGVQLNYGTTALDYFKTTDRFNVPALDYTNDTCPALSLEPARTNLLLQSETFDNASWTKTETTVTANSVAGPNGLTTADSILETVTNATHRVQQSITKAASSIQYSFTCYLKPNGRSWVLMQLLEGANGAFRYFDITNGALGTSGTSGAGFTLNSSTITLSSNGFYRCEIVVTTNTAITAVAQIFAASADNLATYAGDITKGFYASGAQLEAGSYATSYIPTTTATVSRIADAVPIKTGIRTSGLTAGCLFVDVFLYSDTTSSRGNLKLSFDAQNFIGFEFPSGVNQVRAIVTTGNVQQMNIICGGNPILSGTRYKMLINFDTNDIQVYTNGSLNAGDAVVAISTAMTNFEFSAFHGYINQIVIYETKLSNAEAIALTTP